MPTKPTELADELAEEAPAPAEEPIDIQPVEAPERPAPPPDYMMLRMPRTVPYSEGYEFPEGNMDFGVAAKHAANHDDHNIKFTADGDGDGYAIVRKDHPALPSLMRRYPQVEVVESNPKPEAYVCDICDREFKTKVGLRNHKLSH